MSRYDALLTGRARYAADLAPDAASLVFVRSPHARARIVAVDVAVARAMPGVHGVFTADDLDLIDIYEIHIIPEECSQPPLARGEVRYVGERVVAVVAATLAQAIDAAAAVVVDYEPQLATTDPRAARDTQSNIALVWDHVAPNEAFAGADIVVSGEIHMPRVANAPIEAQAIVAEPECGRINLWPSTQSPQSTNAQITRSNRVGYLDMRVRVPFVGGSFGGKAVGGIPDYVLAAAVARRLQVPVKCIELRSDNLTCMQARGMRLTYSLYARNDGTVVGVDVDELCDSGAYPVTNAVEPGKTHMMMCGPYRIEAASFFGHSVVTNLAPTGAYRGPGRSEAAAVLEHGVDQLAQHLGVDPVEIRRRNLLGRDELPHETPTGAHLDESDYCAALDLLVEASGYHRWRAEQAQRRARGDRCALGLGVSTVVDSSAWFARDERVDLRVDGGGQVTVITATASAGQDHDTAFVQLVTDVLPVDASAVTLVAGDTDLAGGFGSSGSRTMQLAGTAIRQAAEQTLVRARELAAAHFEAAVDDIELTDRMLTVRGVPSRAIAWAEIAARAHEEQHLDSHCLFQQPGPTYAFGAQLAVVEVDTETGRTAVVGHYAVTDCGTVLDPAGASGQVVGASAQGIGQVLFEEAIHDPAGNPLNASFAEYLVPSAAEMPAFETWFTETPSTRNPLGAKGVGEIGMVAAPAAVYGAVLDALEPFGVRGIDWPCTPERVWTAINRSAS